MDAGKQSSDRLPPATAVECVFGDLLACLLGDTDMIVLSPVTSGKRLYFNEKTIDYCAQNGS